MCEISLCQLIVSTWLVGVGVTLDVLEAKENIQVGQGWETKKNVVPRSSLYCGILGSIFRFLSASSFEVPCIFKSDGSHASSNTICYVGSRLMSLTTLLTPWAPTTVFLESMEICQIRLQRLCWLNILEVWPTWHLTAQEWCPSFSFLTEDGPENL